MTGNALDAIRAAGTSIVADTGEFELLNTWKPEDATTNPSLVLQLIKKPAYQGLISKAIESCKSPVTVHRVSVELLVLIGIEILKRIPGRVSIEVNADLSFDSQAMISQAHDILERFAAHGIDRRRILIKLASTWEGVQACKALESQGITCNMTLIFNVHQAAACAQANATLISPFVGRIYDWHIAKGAKFDADHDPGVMSVKQIYALFKQRGYNTIVMGASFRSTDQILRLSGCDKLTISPTLLSELTKIDYGAVKGKAILDGASAACVDTSVSEKTFRWELNKDPMACEKLDDGIRLFYRDLEQLRTLVSAAIEQRSA